MIEATIKEAKQEIQNAIVAYFTKDELGDYAIPIEKQRPIFLIGPPGIGKTAIMEQIASELNVGLLSYSMTHHTRQSALGLPNIKHKVYGGKEYEISEYTMSEIVASVYDLMEETGVKEGILFLDEINCVSETLAPIMLQFLQYKVFGRHRIPDGWIVVTAGNPPEYNSSVREFDIVTLDRLKRIDIRPDFDAWKEYAYKRQIHPAILTFLQVKKNCFYRVETTVDGKAFVTARGWEDLSRMIQLYDQNEIPVTETLIAQYLQHEGIAKEFSMYYDLFMKYRSDYEVERILDGDVSDEIKARARAAKFDERLALLGMILDLLTDHTKQTVEEEILLNDLLSLLQGVRKQLKSDQTGLYSILISEGQKKRALLENGEKSASLSKEALTRLKRMIEFLREQSFAVRSIDGKREAFDVVAKNYNAWVSEFTANVEKTSKMLDNAFRFVERVFESGQEILILVTELTANHHTAKYISNHGCDAYFRHNKELLFYERQQEIIRSIQELALGEPDGSEEGEPEEK